MPLHGTYLGMQLTVDDSDVENLEYFRHCGAHDYRLQRCIACGLMRYPPTTGCPWCASPDAEWAPVEGRGTVHSYSEVTHAIMPAYREHLPYALVLVDLDTQLGQPTEHEALRIVGNLVLPDGTLAGPDVMATIGIGTRVRMVFVDAGEGIAIPQWMIDESAEQPERPWRYQG